MPKIGMNEEGVLKGEGCLEESHHVLQKYNNGVRQTKLSTIRLRIRRSLQKVDTKL